MKLLKTLGAVLCIAMFCLLVVPTAMADDYNRKTVVTFSGPVEVPGVGAQTLPAGTYVFKILDSQSDRHIVQIFNQDETHLYTTILAIPNYRLKSTSKTVITFRERPAGQPEALRAWFYPGHEWGEEFVYAKSRAIELAKETNQPVLATPIELDAAPVEALKTAPIVAVDPKGEPVELAQVVEPPPAPTVEPAAAPAPAAAPVVVAAAELPKTASSLPLIALLGLLTLSAGIALSLFSKRTA
jgi:LPXTG-motif cell wall-anchored protein